MPVAMPPEIDEADAPEILRWAEATHGEGLVFTSSFEDPVLVHLVVTWAPSARIVMIDTQYLFAETQWYAQRLQERLGFRLEIARPTVEPDDLWTRDVEGCCNVRKVEPLARVLAGRTGWITGIRRADGPTRASTPIVMDDLLRGVTKINPLAAWSDDQMHDYETLHDLPRNPLVDKGYASIGCWPCTRPVAPGEDRRSGRWVGSEKTECGLHGR